MEFQPVFSGFPGNPMSGSFHYQPPPMLTPISSQNGPGSNNLSTSPCSMSSRYPMSGGGGSPGSAIYNPGSMASPFSLHGNPLIAPGGAMLNHMGHHGHPHAMSHDLTGVPTTPDDWYSKSLSAFKMSHVAAAAVGNTSPQSVHAHLQHSALMPY